MKKLAIAQAASIADSKYIFLGLPTDLGAKSERKGRIEAPDKIRELSENWFIPFKGSIDESKIYDAGNLSLDRKDMLANIQLIKTVAQDYFRQGKKLVALGGDCSIKYGILSGLNELNKKISVIYIDSHPDLVIADVPYYGSVMGDCLKLGNIDFAKCVYIGLREIEEREMKLIKEKKIAYFTPLDIGEQSLSGIFRKIRHIVKGNQVYIALDIDSVDPSMAPAVGCIAPGGLSSTEILSLIDNLKTLDPVGLDITEFIPKYDINNITGKLIYRIIHEFMAE
jgi:agmatinase